MSGGCFTSFMIFFLIISVGLIFWAYSEYQFTRTVIGKGILVSAEVIDINQLQKAPATPNNPKNSTAPRLEFAYKGDTVWYDSEQYSNLVDYHIGERVEVYVNPQQPTKSVINTWSEKWGTATILGVLGAVFSLLSVGSLLSTWRNR